MTQEELNRLGKTLWDIADQLRGAMNADDFRDYMLSFLFLRYLSDNYEAAAKKELGRDYPQVDAPNVVAFPNKEALPEETPLEKVAETPGEYGNGSSLRRPPLAIWYEQNPGDVEAFEKQMRRKVHYVIEPKYLWSSIAEQARTQDDELLHTLQQGFKYIENHSFDTSFQGLFSEINLDSEKLGRKYADRNKKLCASFRKSPKALRSFPPTAISLAMPMNT